MNKIIYNQKEKTGRIPNSSKKGKIDFNEETRSFSCDTSNIIDMGIFNIPPIFAVMLEETREIKVFKNTLIKRDDECFIEYWKFESKDGFSFQVND